MEADAVAGLSRGEALQRIVMEDDEKKPDEKDCTKYFKCIKGEYRKFKCPSINLEEQYYFDINTKNCTTQQNAVCFPGIKFKFSKI